MSERPVEEIEKILVRRADGVPGEEVTFRVREIRKSQHRGWGIVDIRAGDHDPTRNSWYPFWISRGELDSLLEKCEHVSNFFIYKILDGVLRESLGESKEVTDT